MGSLKILQIGAGSMGTRRMRDLHMRSDVELALFDTRRDRLVRAKERFGIATYESLEKGLAWKPDALIISTPPDTHHKFIELSLDMGLHHFCEASIWTFDYKRAESVSGEKGLVCAPSFSFYFIPIVAEMKRIALKELGRLHSYQMYLSTYLLTWHPGEGDEYYARHRKTAAAREMVPFELSFLNHVFGMPECVTGIVSRCGRLDVDSEDTWCLQMKLQNGGVGQLAVMMASPQLLRKGLCSGDNGIAEFDLLTGEIRVDLPGTGIHEVRNMGILKEVLEDSYSREINTFVDAVSGNAEWPLDYRTNAVTTAVLAAAEKSSLSGMAQKVNPLVQPALQPDMY